MKSPKKRSIARQDEIHRVYLMAKKLYREFRKLAEMLSEIRETVERILATLEESNKKSAVFWAEFKRDFPEIKLDEVKWRSVVYGDNSPTRTSDAGATPPPDCVTRN